MPPGFIHSTSTSNFLPRRTTRPKTFNGVWLMRFPFISGLEPMPIGVGSFGSLFGPTSVEFSTGFWREKRLFLSLQQRLPHTRRSARQSPTPRLGMAYHLTVCEFQQCHRRMTTAGAFRGGKPCSGPSPWVIVGALDGGTAR